MSELKMKPRPEPLATLASAVVGSALFVLLLFHWPRQIVEWMRIIVSEGSYPEPAGFAAIVAVFSVSVAFALALAIIGAHWLLRRLRVSSALIGIAAISIIVFTTCFAFEAVSHVVRAWGNLTASDAAGPIIENGSLTLHGWETSGRRAVVATLYANIMAAVYYVVSSMQR